MTLAARLRLAWAEVRSLVLLAVPIVLGLAASTLLGVTDSLMLAPLGPVPLAAVGLTTAVAVVVIAATYGVLTVLGVRIGAAHGAGDARRIPFLLRNGLALGALVGTLGVLAMAGAWLALPLFGQPAEVLAAMPAYWAFMSALMLPFALLTVFKTAFEAVNRPWLGTGFAFLAVIINIPLNYVLIWGLFGLPALGLTGAGIASLLAEAIALLVAWVFWSRARSMRRLRLRRPLSRAEIAAAWRAGAPLGLLYIAETGAMAAGTVIIGLFGTVALAAGQVTQSIGALLYMVPLGIAGAVSVRVAQAGGAGEAGRLRAIVGAALGISTLWLATAAVMLVLFGREIAGAITDDPAVVALAAGLFVALATLQIWDGVQSTMLGALRGMSDTAWPAMVSLVAYWAVALPAAWVLAFPLGFGPAGVWLGFGLALAAASVALTLRFRARTAAAVRPAPSSAPPAPPPDGSSV